MTANPNRNFSRTAVAALGAIIILAFQAWFTTSNARDLCDDALISARYARNWARGDGLTYNRDGQPPVEGYSNFLWVATLAAGFKLGLEPRPTTAAAGAACGLAATLLVGLWVWRVTHRRTAALAAMATLGLSLPFNLWAVQGLETPLIALLFLAVAVTLDDDRPRPWPWLFALLAAMTRPDGILAAATLAVIELRRPAPQRPAMLRAALWFVLPFAAYTLWRWSHFGALLPNTFGAKTGMGMAGFVAGVTYLSLFIQQQSFIAGLGGIALIAGIALRRKPQIFFVLLMVETYLIFIVAVGGDFMPHHRFVMHLLPLVVGLACNFIAHRPKQKFDDVNYHRRLKNMGTILPAIIIIFAAISMVSSFARNMRSSTYQWHQQQEEWYAPPADWLQQNAKRTDVIAAGDIGYLGYITDADRILDFNGLVDRHLASLPGAASLRTDPAYVFDQQPAWIVLMVHLFDDGRELGHSAFDRAALASPRLASEYQLQKEFPGWWQMVPAAPGEPPTLLTSITFRIYRRQ